MLQADIQYEGKTPFDMMFYSSLCYLDTPRPDAKCGRAKETDFCPYSGEIWVV